MSKSEWVKAYMAEHGCSHQAAYKAWTKLQPATETATETATMQPSATTSVESRLTLLEAQAKETAAKMTKLTDTVNALKASSGVTREMMEKLRTATPRPEILDAVGPSRGSKQGKIEMPRLLPHKRW